MMNTFEEIKALLRAKSGKRLVAFSVAAFLLITALVFFATFKLCESIQLKLMDEYLWEIPEIIDSSRNELLVGSRAYEDDALAHAELGLKLYEDEEGLPDEERLQQVRAAVSAASVSLLDEQGKLLSTTGPVSPEEAFNACIQSLEPRQAHWELYPALAEGGTETGKNDGRLFVRLPMTGNGEHSLVFEFSCEELLEMNDALSDWADTLKIRAVDNELFFIGAAAARYEGFAYECWGHSAVYDPFGIILAEADETEQISFADLDLARVDEVRAQLPTFLHLRRDVYAVAE